MFKESIPLITVIVPNYNHEKYLRERLESVFNQTYPNFEVILLDDCSTDSSRTILLEYADNPKLSHCVFNATNSGNTFIQWNKGIALAKGDFIWIAESDDFCELNFLEELTKPLIVDDTIVLAYSQSHRVDENSKITGNWLNHTDDLDTSLFLTNFVMAGNVFIERYLIYKNVIPNASGVVFKKSRAVQIGKLNIDPVLKYCGDWLFYTQLLTNSNMVYIPKILNSFRYHSKSVISGAVRKLNWGSIIEIDFEMRRNLFIYLSQEKPYNLTAIQKRNKQVVTELNYERGLFYYENGKKIKGGLIMLTVLDVFVRKNNLKERFISKSNKFFRKIKKQ
jgi:glycosyltransferase involved in cell wall biosynthesis